MLSDDIKKQIQTAYSQLLESRQWKPRFAQRQMIAEIAKSVGSVEMDGEGYRSSQPSVCVVEAGTGTGKTLAYALAAIPIAQALEKRLVIATATVALQEQIVFKDLPDLKKHSGLEFSFNLAKGRRRYVCLARLDKHLHQKQDQLFEGFYPDEQAFASEQQQVESLSSAMIDALSLGKWNGERDSWSEVIDDSLWMNLSVDRTQCSGRHCPFVSQCSFFKAREQLEDVDCIVTNHDLLLSDLNLGGGAILSDPADSIYVIDEAHQIASKTLQHFSNHVRLMSSMAWVEQLSQVPSMLEQNFDIRHQQKEALERLSSFKHGLEHAALIFRHMASDYPEEVATAEQRFGDANSDADLFRYKQEASVPDAVSEHASLLSKHCAFLESYLENMQAELESLSKEDNPAWEEAWGVLGLYESRIQQHQELWSAYARQSQKDNSDSPNIARWWTVVGDGDGGEVDIHASPVLANNILAEHCWDRAYACVLSSATLCSLGNFDRLKQQTGLPENTVYSRLQSPFDPQNVQINVPNIPCEPKEVDAHTDYIIEIMPQLLSRYRGNLVLFASRKQMRNVYDALDESLQKAIIHQDEYSKIEILRKHKKRIDDGKQSTIFGLASFSEGVDLPGDYCQHVIIAKLPFAVPGHPVEENLAEWIRLRGGNPFMEIAVPDAAQALTQACGRLQRKESDHGEITLLDRRIVSRRYGRAILDSLPAYQRNLN